MADNSMEEQPAAGEPTDPILLTPALGGGAGSRDQHGGALQPAVAQIGKRVIRARERVGDRLGPNTGFGRQCEEFLGVAAGQVGDRAQRGG